MTRAVGASERVFEIMDRKPLFNISGGITPSNIEGKIQFSNVTFSYPQRKDKVVYHEFYSIIF